MWLVIAEVRLGTSKLRVRVHPRFNARGRSWGRVVRPSEAGGGHITVHGSAHQLLQECMHGWWIDFYSRGKRPTCFAPTLKPGDSYAPPRHSTSYPWARRRRILRFPPDDRQFGSNPSGRKQACRKVTCCHVWSEIRKRPSLRDADFSSMWNVLRR